MSLNFENVGKEVIYNRSVDNIEDYVKGTIVGCYIGTDEEYYITSIESSGECIKISDDSLLEIINSGGGSGAVTPASIVTATGQMTDAQAATTRENLGAEPEKFVVTVTEDGQGGYTADKTFAQISEAYQSGSTIIIIFKHYAAIAVYSEVTNVFAATCFIEIARDEVFRAIIGITSNGIVFPSHQQLQLASNIEEIADDATTITPEVNTIYLCDTLTSLTISNPPSTGSYSLVFTSGSTATSTTFPATILGLEDFAAEANTLYEINVLDNRAVVGSWKVTA